MEQIGYYVDKNTIKKDRILALVDRIEFMAKHQIGVSLPYEAYENPARYCENLRAQIKEGKRLLF